MTTETKRLVNDLKIVGRDAEDLVKATAGDLTDKAKEARARLITAVESAKDACLVLQDKAITGARITDRAIRQNPYYALGIALSVGLLAGFLTRRASRS
jgi:ElaB/YqjD/DUF883 family membrane-anchored ribosome-binding protein